MHSFILSNFSDSQARAKILELAEIDLNEEKFKHHPDIFHIYPEINEKTVLKKPSIKIEQIRQIPAMLGQKPIDLDKKILIVWQAESIGPAGANAFLKFLEEPSQQTFIFLVVKNYQALLPTIQSRCQIVINGNKNLEEIIADFDIDFAKLYKAQPAQRMVLIEGEIKDRGQALSWLENLLSIIRPKLPLCSSKGLKSMAQLAQNIQTIYQDVGNHNVNYKIGLDMIAIFWDKPIKPLTKTSEK